jgi:hypothetical protein
MLIENREKAYNLPSNITRKEKGEKHFSDLSIIACKNRP